MRPAITPRAVPAPVSQSESRPQKASSVHRYARSVNTTISRKAMGKGTTMGWIGWRSTATAVGVLRGRGCPSFFMAASRQGVRKGESRKEQVACRLRYGLVLPWLASLTACVQSPLSTMDPASDVTRSVAALWWSMAAGTGVILLLMVGLAALALRRQPPRAPGDRGVRALLVVGGLVLPTSVIAALLIFGLRLDEAQWPPGARDEAPQAFHVDVIAHQWWWEVRYPALDAGQVLPRMAQPVLPAHEAQPPDTAARTVNVVHVPAGVPVHLRIMATDVIHGFWVPRISGKLDAVPGRVNRLRLLVDQPGEYAGVCAEYCGQGHARMPFTLVAHAVDDLDSLAAAVQEDAR